MELQPIQQEHRELTPTGERLENLPPQGTSDRNFDTDSYVHNLHRQIREDQSISKQTRETEDLLAEAEKVEVKPMKFDGKQLRGANVDTVTAPKAANKNLGPIIIVVILILLIVGVAIYIFTSGILNPKTVDISFTKPDSWTDDVYAYVISGDKKNADWPGEKMTKGEGKNYTYTVSENLKDGKVVFNDGANTHRYPAKDEDAMKIEANKTYTADTAASKPSTSSTASKTSK